MAILPETKSVERIAFEIYLRTGIRGEIKSSSREHKFNPYHDPRNGRFTFAPGHSRASIDVKVPPKRSGNDKPFHLSEQTRTASNTRSPFQPLNGTAEHAVYRPGIDDALSFEEVQNRPPRPPATWPNPRPFPLNDRARTGGNNPPPDPLTLVDVFPRLHSSVGGGIVSAIDNIFDLSGPANRLTRELATAEVKHLIRQIQTVNPGYRLDTLGFPKSFEGQMNLVQNLRVERASSLYRATGDVRPLQVETLRFLRKSVDEGYHQAVQLFDAGRIKPRLSREEALGNFVDLHVRRASRRFYERAGIEFSKEGPIRVVGREYDTSKLERTYTVPDLRVGQIAIDVSLTRKTILKPQVSGFFGSDFRPEATIIVRPSQLGADSMYAIRRPRTKP